LTAAYAAAATNAALFRQDFSLSKPGWNLSQLGKPSSKPIIRALRCCSAPSNRKGGVTFALPEIKSAGDAAAVVSAVLAAVAAGELTPTDAAEIGKLIDSYVRAFETAEIAERLERLERMTPK
jgi:hypothetical protein